LFKLSLCNADAQAMVAQSFDGPELRVAAVL
jgi:hypothetical protein